MLREMSSEKTKNRDTLLTITDVFLSTLQNNHHHVLVEIQRSGPHFRSNNWGPLRLGCLAICTFNKLPKWLSGNLIFENRFFFSLHPSLLSMMPFIFIAYLWYKSIFSWAIAHLSFISEFQQRADSTTVSPLAGSWRNNNIHFLGVISE